MEKLADVFEPEVQPPSYKERLRGESSILKNMTPTQRLMLTIAGLGMTAAGANAARPFIKDDPRLVDGKMRMWGDDVEHKDLKKVEDDDDRELSASDKLLSDMIPDDVLMAYMQESGSDSGPDMPDMD